MEQVTHSGVTEEIFKDLRRLIAYDPAELGVEGSHVLILSRASTFWSIEAMVHE